MSSARVSFILMCYEQESFVAAAIRAAFEQTFPAMEIILSDDCSPDATYQVLAREAAGYRGPHRVRLNRNPENLGSVGHLNHVLEIAEGDFIVIAHGDDVALPHRTRTLVESWRRHGVSLVCSDVTITDRELQVIRQLDDGAESGLIAFDDMILNGSPRTLVGATMAFERDVFGCFGPVDLDILPVGPVDQLLPLRAGLLKGVWFVAEPLVLWRQHGRNMTRRFVNRFQGPGAIDESLRASLLAVKVCMLEEIMSLNRRGAASEPQLQAQRRLQVAILRHLPSWVRARSALMRKGARQVWIDRREFDAMSSRRPAEAVSPQPKMTTR